MKELMPFCNKISHINKLSDLKSTNFRSFKAVTDGYEEYCLAIVKDSKSMTNSNFEYYINSDDESEDESEDE